MTKMIKTMATMVEAIASHFSHFFPNNFFMFPPFAEFYLFNYVLSLFSSFVKAIFPAKDIRPFHF
ncbi:MAG: hypothetical protein PHR36_02770 [Patescibacteria group bacterium]|nr:hypothetical protein [Patescibacteria group bacterium]